MDKLQSPMACRWRFTRCVSVARQSHSWWLSQEGAGDPEKLIDVVSDVRAEFTRISVELP
jgi:hypothetical protein